MAIVPPGGFAGFAQMTPASKASWFRPGRASGGGRRRKTKRAKATKRRKSSGRKIKFGSPAWRKKYNLGKKRR